MFAYDFQTIRAFKQIRGGIAKLNATQSQLLKTQKAIAGLQVQQALLQKKQLQVETQQLAVQEQALVQQQIQTQLALEDRLRRDRQRDLKNAVFTLRQSLEASLQEIDRLVQLVLVRLLADEARQHELEPNSLEEIADKTFAAAVLSEIGNAETSALTALTVEERSDLQVLESDLPRIGELHAGHQHGSGELARLESARAKMDQPISRLEAKRTRLLANGSVRDELSWFGRWRLSRTEKRLKKLTERREGLDHELTTIRASVGSHETELVDVQERVESVLARHQALEFLRRSRARDAPALPATPSPTNKKSGGGVVGVVLVGIGFVLGSIWNVSRRHPKGAIIVLLALIGYGLSQCR